MRFFDRDEVARRLTYPAAIRIVREAMIALSRGETRQLLRSIITLSPGRLYGTMTGALAPDGPFGSKLISAFQGNRARGLQSHQGLVVLFVGADVLILYLWTKGKKLRLPTRSESPV